MTVTLVPLTFSGCLTAGEFTPIKRYALRSAFDVTEASRSESTLGVRPLDYVRFYKEPMVYREDDFQVAYDDYHYWAELPRDAVSRILLDGLSTAGGFADVGYSHEMPRPDLLVGGELRRFDQVRTAETWTALCEVRLELRDRSTGSIRWSGTLTAEAPLESQDAAGFAAAMNVAVSELVSDAVERIVSHDESS